MKEEFSTTPLKNRSHISLQLPALLLQAVPTAPAAQASLARGYCLQWPLWLQIHSGLQDAPVPDPSSQQPSWAALGYTPILTFRDVYEAPVLGSLVMTGGPKALEEPQGSESLWIHHRKLGCDPELLAGSSLKPLALH